MPVDWPLIERWAFDMEYMQGGFGLGAARDASLALEWPVFEMRHQLLRAALKADQDAIRNARQQAEDEADGELLPPT